MKGLVRTLFVSALLLFGAFTASAPADDPPAPLQLGLGDSWATGVGDFGERGDVPEGGYVPDLYKALKEDFKCSWTEGKEAEAGCPHLKLINLAISGSVTAPQPEDTPPLSPSLTEDQFPRALPLLQSRNLNTNPRDDVEVTTLHIGGNDVTNPILGACLFASTQVSCAPTIQNELAAYRNDLDRALSMLREAAGEEAKIVIGTYDNPIPTCFLAQRFPGEAVPLADLILEGGSFVLRGEILVVPKGLHDIMRDVGEDYGVEVAEVYGDLAPEDWLGGTDCLHPDDSGYDKVAKAFEEVLGVGQPG
jgi:lysophospholipase L1-like esterase